MQNHLEPSERSTCEFCGFIITGLSDRECTTKHFFPTNDNAYVNIPIAHEGKFRSSA